MFTTKEISHSDRIKLGLKRKHMNTWKRRTIEWIVMVNVALISSLTINSLFEFKLQPFLTVVHNVKTEARASEPVKGLTTKDHICSATNGENCDVLYNLCVAESGKWLKDLPEAERCNQWSVGKNTNGTFDYSWYQINDVHIIGRPASKGKGTITIECAYDLYCSSRWVNEQVKSGRGSIWTAWDKI